MGKKISIDSATMMNKVFEIIEAKKIFNLSYNKLSILIHPKSYVHAIIKFKNGLTKIIVHDTNMKIPIFNSLYSSNHFINSRELNLKTLNNLELKNIDYMRFPVVKILNTLPEKSSLYESVLVIVNDYLVSKFLNNEINFRKLINMTNKISNLKEFQKFKKIKPKNVRDIYTLRDYVSLKMNSLGI